MNDAQCKKQKTKLFNLEIARLFQPGQPPAASTTSSSLTCVKISTKSTANSNKTKQTIMTQEAKRYIRLNPRFDRDETLSSLKVELVQQQSTTDSSDGSYPLPVNWLHPAKDDGQYEFYAIPADFPLNRSPLFQSGRVYGMDVTSGAAVLALLYDRYDDDTKAGKSTTDGKDSAQEDKLHLRVLDLCCAPGIKLCMLADLVPLPSTVIGVDISQHRIQLCKNIIKKYHTNQLTSAPTNPTSSSNVTIQLYCTDGTSFGTKQLSGLVFDSNAEKQELKTQGKRKRQNKSARAREKRRLLELQRQGITDAASCDNEERTNNDSDEQAHDKSIETNATCISFDRVLVDAECSTDGAIRHIQKRDASSKAPLWNDSNMSELIDLQKRLIESGFRLLKSGGALVYSTCSMNEKQNEDVVRWLLEKNNDAFIIPVSFNKGHKSQKMPSFVAKGSLAGTIRFNPLASASDGIEELCLPGTGFFLSKIGKK